MEISWILWMKVYTLPLWALWNFGHDFDIIRSTIRQIQDKTRRAITGYVSQIKKLVWPVLANLHYMPFASNSILLFPYLSSNSLAFLITSCTGQLTKYLVILEFCSHSGTSKNTKLPQNRTPEYMFCAGTLFTSTEQVVIWALLNRNMNRPDFFTYWKYGFVVNYIIWFEIWVTCSIMAFQPDDISGDFITNHVSQPFIPYAVTLNGLELAEV